MKKKVVLGIGVILLAALVTYLYFNFIYDERSNYVTSEISRLERILKEEPGEIADILDKTIDHDSMTSLNEFTNGFDKNGRLERDFDFKDVPYYEVNSYYLYQVMETDLIPMFYVDNSYNIYYFDGERD